jgi:DNA-binding SARP family transcriptional activator
MQVSFLGRAVIETAGGQPVEIRGTQPALVLAFLVLERPRPLLREELVELLWPEAYPDRWEGVARQVVSRARRVLVQAGLAPDVLTSADGVTSLEIPDQLDVDVERAFSQVLDAEGLVEGGDWAAAAGLARPAFDSLRHPFLGAADAVWVLDWRNRVGSFARRALHASAAAALGTGRSADAVELARAALKRDPFEEQATRLLMAAWEQAGNRAAALAAYETLRRLLDAELGVRPSGETEDAYRRLLGAPPRLTLDDAPRPASSATGGASGLFVGRRAEIASLAQLGRGTRDGGCQVVVVEGEAGIGKTRLVLEAADAAKQRGASVLWGRCDPLVGVAHGPFADAIGQLIGARPEVLESLGAVAAHLAPLVPHLVPRADDAMPVSSEQATARLFRAVGTALSLAADRPLLVIVDDLHWADGDTLALLRHVVARLANRSCLVVLILREPPPPVAGALAEIDRLVPTTTLGLEGLSVGEVTELLDASSVDLPGGADAVGAAVAARTAGNPLYVTQLVREAEDAGGPFDPNAVPTAIARLLERRLSALDAELTSLLVLSAVAGPTFELSTVEACLARGGDEVLDAVEELCRHRYLEERGPGQFGFVHDLVRDAVLATVTATRQARLHRRLGEALASAQADPAAVAHHFVAAGPACEQQAVTWSLIAGHAVFARAAWARAAEHFSLAVRMAAEPHRRAEALIGMGRSQRALGEAVAARATLENALALARVHGLPHPVAGATLVLVGGGGRGVCPELTDAERARLLRAALDGLKPDDVDLLVPVLTELALALVLTDAADERRALSEQCLAVARRWGDPAGLATALWGRRIALMGPAGTRSRRDDGREVLALPRAEVPLELVIGAQLGLVEDLLELGDRPGADRALDVASNLAAALDHPYWSWATACWRTLSVIIDGRPDEAEQLAFAALTYQPGDHPEAVAALGVNLTDVRLFQGRAGEVVDLLRVAADDNPQIPAYRAVLALCSAEAGDLAGARAAYDTFATRGFELPRDSNWLLAVAVLADTCATLGDDASAEVLETLLEPWTGRQVVLNCYGGGGAYWGPVDHHLARLAATRGDHDRACELLTRAVCLSEEFRAPQFAARSRAARAGLATHSD